MEDLRGCDLSDQYVPLPEAEWSEIEHWTWERCSSIGVADLNAELPALHPTLPGSCFARRKLRPAFLMTLLLGEAYRPTLTRLGLRINGAYFEEPLILRELSIPHRLQLECCRFEEEVDLAECRAERRLSFKDCYFNESLALARARVGSYLSLSGIRLRQGLDATGLRVESDVNLEGAIGTFADCPAISVGGQLQLSGVRFRKRLNFQGANIGSDLFIDNARVKALDLTDATIGGQLVLTGARCVRLTMQAARVGSDLDAREGCFWGFVHAVGLQVSGDAMFDECEFRWRAEFNDMKVGLGLSMDQVISRAGLELKGIAVQRNAMFQHFRATGPIDLKWARIGGQLNIATAHLDDLLDLEAAHIQQYLFLRDGPGRDGGSDRHASHFSRIRLTDAKVDGTVYARGSIFSGALEWNGLSAGYIWLRSSTFKENVSACGVTVQRDIDLSASHFEKGVDFTSSQIGGALDLGCAEIGGPSWEAGARLTLRDVSVSVLRDRSPADSSWGIYPWPPSIQFDNFNYSRLGAHTIALREEIAISDQDAEWYKKWLGPKARVSSYRKLASVLSAQGRQNVADKILYEASEEARRSSTGIRKVGLTLFKVLVGYGIGYGYWLSILWAILLSALGAGVFYRYSLATHTLEGENIWLFSLDQLLPVIKLDARSDKIAGSITGGYLLYLALHRTLGFILSSFVVAGLSGITRK